MTRPGEEQRPTYLTEVGRRHLEDRLGEYVAQRARMTAQSTDPTDVQDSVDQSDRLEAADELARLDDQIAHVQDTLRRALPLPAGVARPHPGGSASHRWRRRRLWRFRHGRLPDA
jgi:hypothetical protein